MNGKLVPVADEFQFILALCEKVLPSDVSSGFPIILVKYLFLICVCILLILPVATSNIIEQT